MLTKKQQTLPKFLQDKIMESKKKDKKNPDRCLPRSKAQSLSKKERAKTARKKKREGSKGKTVVKNTKPATVKLSGGGLARRKRKIAKGCGQVMENRRKKTLFI